MVEKTYTANSVLEVVLDEYGLARSVTTYDVKSSLWQDYIHFKHTIGGVDFAPHMTKRYLRVSLMLLFAHMEATITFILDSSDLFKADKGNNQKLYLKKNGVETGKIVLINRVLGLNYELPNTVRRLRNYLTHFGGKKEAIDEAVNESSSLNIQVFETLSMELLQSFEDDLIIWLDQACERIGQSRLVSRELTEALAKGFSQEDPTIHEI